MPLQRQAVSVSFSQGLETKADPKQVVAGKLLTLQNGVLTAPGKVAKRNGYAALPALPTIAAGQFIGSHGSETVASDGTSLYSLEAATNAWVNKGSCRSVGVARDVVVRGRSGTFGTDSAINGGLALYAYVGKSSAVASGLYYTVKDIATGQIVVYDTLVDVTIVKVPRVIAIGSIFVIIYATGANYGWRVVNVATPGTVSGFNVIVASALSVFDAVLEVAFNRVYVALQTAGFVNVFYLTSTGTLAVPTTSKAIGGNLSAVGVWAESSVGSIVVGYHITAGNLLYWGLNSALADLWAPTVIEAPASPCISITGWTTSAGTGQVFYTEYNAAAAVFAFHFTRTATYATSTPSAPADFKRGVCIVTRPVLVGSIGVRFMLMQYVETATVCPYLLVDMAGNVIARVAQEDGAFEVFAFGYRVRSLMLLSGLTYSTAITTIQNPIGSGTFGADGVEIDFDNPVNRYQTAQLANALHINGGLLQMYDGQTVVEHGFHWGPATIAATDGGAAGGSLSAGQYQWACVYEWTDASGALHQSVPSPVTTVAGWTLNHQAALVVPTLKVTAKANVFIRIYRTQANGSVFYQVNNATTDTTILYNDPTVDSLAYTDAKPDTTIAAQPLLYTQQQVAATPGPPCTALAVYRNRLMAVSSEQPLSIWYSLQVVPGQPAQMSDFLIQNIDPADAPVTALGTMDDKLVIFKGHQAMYLTGDGPDALGNNNTFSTPITIDATSGCIYPSSVVTMNTGLAYQSAKGLRLLSRGLAESYFGEGVEALVTGQQVVGAVVIPSTNEVRFDLFNGTVLVWDYYLEQWASFVFPEAIQAHRSAAICSGVFTVMTNGGTSYQETPGVYTDAGTAIVTKLVTSWLQFAGLQGFQRAYKLLVLGDFYTSHILNVSIAYDFNPAIIQTDATQINATPEQFRIFLARQKCEAIQVTISDQQANPGGQSVAISALALEIGVKRGAYKLPAANSFG